MNPLFIDSLAKHCSVSRARVVEAVGQRDIPSMLPATSSVNTPLDSHISPGHVGSSTVKTYASYPGTLPRPAARISSAKSLTTSRTPNLFSPRAKVRQLSAVTSVETDRILL